jgi:hypothetical protein
MATISVKKARKIMGKKSLKYSDEEIERIIDTAKLFKEMFFLGLTQGFIKPKDKSKNI